jgi:hypothetical protein
LDHSDGTVFWGHATNGARFKVSGAHEYATFAVILGDMDTWHFVEKTDINIVFGYLRPEPKGVLRVGFIMRVPDNDCRVRHGGGAL